MELLELTLPTPAENLALDEALLEEADEADRPRETLRLWESRQACVVVGRSSQVAQEVRLDACREREVPVLRRTSGGATVVIGPGCLMYSLILDFRGRPHLEMIHEAHAAVLDVVARGLAPLAPGLERQGTSDLAVDGRKVSGNSLRCKRRTVLYHGTLLYDFPLPLVAQCLAMPARQPDYRRGRSHEQFLANLCLARSQLREALVAAWQAHRQRPDWPAVRTRELAESVYRQDSWNLRR